MNRDHPLILSDESLYKKAFRWQSSEADCRYFRQSIVEFLKFTQSQSFTQFMWEAIWRRNCEGLTIKYLHFNEKSQRLSIDPYFYEWMKRTIHKAEDELKQIKLTTHPQGDK